MTRRARPRVRVAPAPPADTADVAASAAKAAIEATYEHARTHEQRDAALALLQVRARERQAEARGAWARELRIDAALSQGALAELLGVSQPRVSAIERGDHLANDNTMRMIARACERTAGGRVERSRRR